MFNKQKKILALLALVLLACLPVAAHAQLYGVSLNGYDDDNPGPSSLYMIDPMTGAGTLIGDIGYPINAIAVDPTSGIMYASEAQWSSNNYSGYLLTVDPSTGAGTRIGPSGDGEDDYCCRALTFDSSGQLWGWDENSDDPVRIDKTTGTPTVVGNAGIGTGGQVLSFDAADTLWLVQGKSVYVVDQVTGAANLHSTLGFDPGNGGADFHPESGLLWASATGGRQQDARIRISNLAGDSYSDLDTDVGYLIAVTFGGTALPEVARFKVTKTFSDGSNDDVNVTLTCTTGLPLTQSATISGGDPTGVTFVVTDLEGTVDCEVTESGSPAGYTPIFNGGAGCAWEDVVASLNTCAISNAAKPGTFTANMEWNVVNEGGDEVNETAVVTITCDSAIVGGTGSGGYWYLTGNLGDGDSLTATVDTTNGPASCSAAQSLSTSGVESTDDCGARPITAGGSSSCTFVNTVFFEGVPTLSQYGLAVLALLMLGVGMVGFRRFA